MLLAVATTGKQHLGKTSTTLSRSFAFVSQHGSGGGAALVRWCWHTTHVDAVILPSAEERTPRNVWRMVRALPTAGNSIAPLCSCERLISRAHQAGSNVRFSRASGSERSRQGTTYLPPPPPANMFSERAPVELNPQASLREELVEWLTVVPSNQKLYAVADCYHAWRSHLRWGER